MHGVVADVEEDDKGKVGVPVEPVGGFAVGEDEVEKVEKDDEEDDGKLEPVSFGNFDVEVVAQLVQFEHLPHEKNPKNSVEYDAVRKLTPQERKYIIVHLQSYYKSNMLRTHCLASETTAQ